MRLAPIILLLTLCGCATSPTTEQIATAEHDECVSYGVSPGDETYVNCRLFLAELRFQREQEQRANMRALGASLRSTGAALTAASQPYVPGNTYTIQTNCVAQTIGQITHYNCR